VTTIIQAFKPLFKLCVFIAPCSVSLPAGSFRAPFPLYYRCSYPRRPESWTPLANPSPDWNSSEGTPTAMHSRADHTPPVVRIQISRHQQRISRRPHRDSPFPSPASDETEATPVTRHGGPRRGPTASQPSIPYLLRLYHNVLTSCSLVPSTPIASASPTSL
jgi:hypothetical protein